MKSPPMPAASAAGVVKKVSLLHFFLLPFLGYAACYLILTFPLVLSFSREFWCNTSDGYQMVWNLWWVRYSLLHLHQSPWHTSMLKYPDGVTLLLHSLTPLNGILSIPLQWMGQVRAYNTLIIFIFAASGLTAFWLAYDQTRSYFPSLLGGFAFTFSAIHYAHASGHLHQIANEFVPLFLLLWLHLLKRPGIWRALSAAFCLWLVFLGDQYLFVYCVVAGAIALIWQLFQRDALKPWRNSRALAAAACFILFTLCTCGTLTIATLHATGHEPIVGLHNPEFYAPSVLELFIPGWQWEWRDLTVPIWTALGEFEERTVSIGIATMILAIIGITLRKRIHFSSTTLWLTIIILFTLLALGPTWRLWYAPLTTHTPYRLLMDLIPAMRFSGCSGRMMIMTQLACAVLAAAGMKALGTMPHRRRLLVGGLLILAMILEAQPPIQTTATPDVPRWVQFLHDYPHPGAVMDNITKGDGQGLYFQKIHQRPIACLDLLRTPLSTETHQERLFAACDAGDVAALSPFRLIVVLPNHANLRLPIVYQDRYAVIYENPNASPQ